MKLPTRTFSRALVQNVAGLVLAIGAAMFAIMLWQAANNTRDTAEQDLNHSLDRSIERLRMLIQAAEMTVDSAERIARISALQPSTLKPAFEQLLSAFEQRPELSYVGIILPAYGEYGNLERTADGQILLWLHPGTRPTDRQTRSFLLKPQGFQLHQQQPPNNYDPRNRPFYREALQGPAEGRWMAAYPWIVHDAAPQTDLWGISYVKALRAANDQLLGVVDVDLDLPAMNRFLQTLGHEYHTDLQIIELTATPRLIGAPGMTTHPTAVPGWLDPLLLPANDNAVHRLTMPDDTPVWAASRRIELQGGLPWLVVATRPAALIESPVRQQLYQAIIMGLIMTIGLALVSARMARRLGRPLTALEQSVEHVGATQQLRIDPVTNEFRETQQLGEALQRMTASIRQREQQLAQQNIELLDAKEQQVASLALKGAIFDSTDVAILSLDQHLRVIEWNPAAERFFGTPRDQALGQPVHTLIQTPEGSAPWPAMLGRTHPSIYPLLGTHGEFDAELRVIALQQHSKAVHTVVIDDVSAARSAERRLRQERDYADAVLNSLPGVFYHCDEHGRLQRWNQNFQRITGLDKDKLLGLNPVLLLPEHEQQRIQGKIGDIFKKGAVHFEATYRLHNGKSVPCLFTGVRFFHDGKPGFVGIGTDISERKRAEHRLQHLATHDALTNLPNRHLLHDRISHAVKAAARTGTVQALLLLDLNRFKVINDAYGHPFGDKIIQAAGIRLAGLLDTRHTVARQGGDQFLILLTDLHQASDAHEMAQAIIGSIRKPIHIQGREIHLSVSVGICLCPADGNDADTLIKHADLAMYHAKRLGPNGLAFFTADMDQQTQQRVSLETALRGAAAAGQLHLLYQPKVSLATGAIIGCEALVRWQHPQLGPVSPCHFIPIAEESGLIVPISDWVLRTACQQAKAWMEAGLPPMTVAVNISAGQLLQHDLAEWALNMLQETGLPATMLELELTESLLAQDVALMIATIKRLKAAGVTLSIDDFGTGYSSLSYLKNFRVDTLKIDQSFVRNMLTEPEDETIVRAVIGLAHSLNLKVIAEGVETRAHCDMLRRHRCDEIQGYYVSKPVTAEAFEAMLRSGKRLDDAPFSTS